jgi:8-oxo-dGTP diphosphatase
MTGRHATVVLAAVIERDGSFLVARRPDHVHLGGRWEFPGGKCDPDESHEDCLRRELREELGVDSAIGAELMVTEHDYADRRVRLHFRRCTVSGEPAPRLGQELRWVAGRDLGALEFPEADRELVAMLTAEALS